MSPTDFQEIGLFNHSLVLKLDRFLQDRESKAAQALLHSIQEMFPSIPSIPVVPLKFNDALETFSRTLHKNPVRKGIDYEHIAHEMSTALWSYVEIVEGSVTELDQQIKQIGFEKWNQELIQGIGAVKELLDQRLEELASTIQRLESLLRDYRGDEGILRRLLFWQTLLDRSLGSFVKRTRTFLNSRYRRFCASYSNFVKIRQKIEHSMVKFRGYQVFGRLPLDVQKEIEGLYELLKIWQQNLKAAYLPKREPVRALRNATGAQQSRQFFTEYYKSLNDALFERSRKLKQDPKDSGRKIAYEEIEGMRAEVHTLAVMIGLYREFYLRTHPNPYIRNRWGFAEWIVGPEPAPAKELLELLYSVEHLNKMFERLGDSVQKGPANDDQEVIGNLEQQVEGVLHEMEQPLTSKQIMQHHASTILSHLEEMNELGSFESAVVEKVGSSLAKAMRADWQFQSLFEAPLFHQLYSLHVGIKGPIDNRLHSERMNTFKKELEEINGWLKKCSTHRHVQEIEANRNDIKMSLHDFLGDVKRIGVELQTKQQADFFISERSYELLEYRYVFGNFFLELQQYASEGKMLRNQLLFVDQYLEAVDSELNALRPILEI